MELKPCPFCGSSGRIDEVSKRHNGKSIDIWHVGCNGDDCFVESIIGFESEEKAVAAWNRRPPCGWQPIGTVPKDGTAVILYDYRWKEASVCCWDDNGWLIAATDEEFDNPTHWMPWPGDPGKEEI